jgi:AmmeMemoRadiSam system protein B
VIRPAVITLGLLSACATSVPGPYPGDPEIWRQLLRPAPAMALPAKPVVAIAPHDLLDGFELTAFWRGVEAQGCPATIALVGPDHYGRGHDVIVADAVRFETELGSLQVDRAASRQLTGERNDRAFLEEHSIFVHAPWVRSLCPASRLVAALVPWRAPATRLERLARELHAALPPDALLVASVDFSHYQSAEWATFHDATAWSTLASLDVGHTANLEADSPGALAVALHFAIGRQALTATRVHHTNAQRKRVADYAHSTSHLYVTFTRGPPTPEPAVTLLLAPDAPELPLRWSWRWHQDTDEAPPAEPRLSGLRGVEDRFFTGADVYLFQLPAGERVQRTIRGTQVAIAAISASSAPAAELTARLKGDADLLVLLVDGPGPLEPLADGAAEVVLGRQRGPMTPAEYRPNGHLLVSSLGSLFGSGPASFLGVTWSRHGLRVREAALLKTAAGLRLDPARLGDVHDRQ